MEITITSPTPTGLKTSHPAVTGYTVRRTYSFDPVTCKHLHTDKPIEFKGRPMEQFRLDSFWKQVQTSCNEFSKYKKYSKVSPGSFNLGIFLLLLGIILLIVGVIPIWGKTPQNIKMVIAAGVLVIFSLVQFLIARFIVKRYMKKKLYPAYAEFIKKAVYEHFEDELHRGLHWRGGRDGFKCIEFWYINEDRSAVSYLNVTQHSKLDTVMYSETADMLKTQRDNGDHSALDMKNFFKDPENQSTLFETQRSSPEPLSVIRLKPVETERDLNCPEQEQNDSQIFASKRSTESEPPLKRVAKEIDIVISKNTNKDSAETSSGTVKKLCGTLVNIASNGKAGEVAYVNMPSPKDQDTEKGL